MKLKLLLSIGFVLLITIPLVWSQEVIDVPGLSVIDVPELIISHSDNYTSYEPLITSLSENYLVISYKKDPRSSRLNRSLIAQKFNIQGEKVSGEIELISVPWLMEIKSKLALLENGELILSYIIDDPKGSSGQYLWGQLYDSSLQKIGAELQVNTRIQYCSIPEILTFSNGDFLVAWNLQNERYFRDALYGQRFTAIGKKIGDEFQINNTVGKDTIITPAIGVKLVNDEFNILWEYLRGYRSVNERAEIWIQQFDQLGRKKGTESKLETNATCFCYLQTEVAFTVTQFPDQSSLLSWHGMLPGTSYKGQFFHQRFDPAGKKIGKEFQVVQSTTSSIAIAPFSDGSYFLCWISEIPTWYNYHDIFGQWVKPSGQRVGKPFLLYPFNLPEQNYRNLNVLSCQDNKVFICYNKHSDIVAKIIPRPQVYALELFNLLEPQNDATITTNRPTFKWRQPGHDKEFYPFEFNFELYVDTDPDFSHPKIFYDIADTCYSPPPIDSLEAGRTYFWKILAKNAGDDSLWCNQHNWGFFVKRGASAVPPQLARTTPVRYSLKQNYPNPFNATTTIPFDLPQRSKVNLIILDLKGREITTLLKEELPAGVHQVVFDATELPSGVYLYRIQTEGFCLTRKLLLVK